MSIIKSDPGAYFLVYHYPGAKRPVVIPKYKEVPVFIIKNNMKVIGMSVEEYLSLLERV